MCACISILLLCTKLTLQIFMTNYFLKKWYFLLSITCEGYLLCSSKLYINKKHVSFVLQDIVKCLFSFSYTVIVLWFVTFVHLNVIQLCEIPNANQVQVVLSDVMVMFHSIVKINLNVVKRKEIG